MLTPKKKKNMEERPNVKIKSAPADGIHAALRKTHRHCHSLFHLMTDRRKLLPGLAQVIRSTLGRRDGLLFLVGQTAFKACLFFKLGMLVF